MNFKKFFKIVTRIVFLFCIFIAIILVGFYYTHPDFFKDNNFFFSTSEKPINILFLGLDKVSKCTDVIILTNFNPETKKFNLLSIPRDTKVVHKGRSYKINSMYAKGNEELAKKKIEELTDQKINYVLVANPKGFRNIIDILGGVEVNVPPGMDYDDYCQNLHIHLKEGIQVLDGEKSEQFIRFRHGYKKGDLDRIDVQQIFFQALIEQKLKPRYILKADDIIKEILDNIQTDITIPQILKYSKYAKDISTENITFLKLPGEARIVSNIWYYIYDPLETEKLINEYFKGYKVEEK